MIQRSALLFIMAAGLQVAEAQQLANPSFEGEWVDCVPWNSVNNTTKLGTQPEGWCISNVLVSGMSLGSNIVGESATGSVGDKAVRLYNVSAASQIVPGYMSLGTTWATAEVKTATPRNEDGGTWGGINWTYRPDAISFDYIHTNGSGSEQPATVSAYMWKGSTSQANVPANNAYNLIWWPTATKVTMVNRDKNILGLTTAQGGAVTYSEDFALVAKLEAQITTNSSEYSTMTVPFDYKVDDAPEMLNVTFGSMDLYAADRSVHKAGDALTVDNVRFIYNSRLSALSVNGVAVDGFDKDTFTYNLDVTYADALAIDYTVLGKTATAAVALDAAKKTATITVTNVDADEDGASSHAYVINFADSTNGIADVIANDANVAPRYYKLNGVEVSNASAPGFYIVRRGNKAEKLYVK